MLSKSSDSIAVGRPKLCGFAATNARLALVRCLPLGTSTNDDPSSVSVVNVSFTNSIDMR